MNFGVSCYLYPRIQAAKIMTNIRTIVFDLGGVLIDYDLQRCLDAFRRLGLPAPERLIDPYKQSGVFLALENGSAQPEDLYRYEVRYQADLGPISENT